MKKLTIILAMFVLTGCSTIKQYWPRAHDPVMFDNLVTIDIALEQQNCKEPRWTELAVTTEHLARYAEWRQDPQAVNLRGLQQHVVRMSQGSVMFCEIGKKTARARVDAAKQAWEGR